MPAFVGATVFANNPSTTVATNGYNGGASTGDAPAALTAETWTVTSSAAFPAAQDSNAPNTQFTVADPAAPSELIYVVNISGTTWSVVRGVESTTPVTHAAGATFYAIVSAGDLTSMKQASGALTSAVNIHGTTTETVVCSYSPYAGEIQAGTTFELVATGSVQQSGIPTLIWNIRWGGLAGTSILSMTTGTNCPALNSSMSVARSFDVNGTVTFITTTSAIANINFWFQENAGTTAANGVVSSATPVTGLTAPPGGGPLVLTAKWGTTSTQNSLVVPGPLVYRAA